jgi:hypothetical protein
LFTSVDGGGAVLFFATHTLHSIGFGCCDCCSFFEMLSFSCYHICSRISAVRKWVGNPLVAYDFVPGGSSTAGAPGLVLYGLVCILPIDSVYTSDPTRECGGCADGARDLVLVLESYNLSNILILSVHSCYTSSVGVPPPFDGWLITSSVGVPPPFDGWLITSSVGVPPPFDGWLITSSVGVPPPFDGWLITSSVHSYLRFIFTAVVLGLVLSWFELYTSRDLMYTSRDLVFVFVFDISI